MDMDVFNFDEEFCAFDGYKRHRRSNLDFLYFSVEDTDAYKSLTSKYQNDIERLRTEYFAKADALGYSDSVKAQKDAIYAELERKLRARKIQYDAEVALLRVNRGATETKNILDIFRSYRDSNVPATVQVNQGQTPISQPRNRTPLFIGLGIVVIGVAGFIAYKIAK
jgi:hypothetical protein